MLERLDGHHPGDRLVEQRGRVIPVRRFDDELGGLRWSAVGDRTRMCNGTSMCNGTRMCNGRRSTVGTVSTLRRGALHDDVFEIAAVRRVRDGHADATTQRHDLPRRRHAHPERQVAVKLQRDRGHEPCGPVVNQLVVVSGSTVVRGERDITHHPAGLHRGARRVVRPETVLDKQPRTVVGHGAWQPQRPPGGRQLQAVR